MARRTPGSEKELDIKNPKKNDYALKYIGRISYKMLRSTTEGAEGRSAGLSGGVSANSAEVGV